MPSKPKLTRSNITADRPNHKVPSKPKLTRSNITADGPNHKVSQIKIVRHTHPLPISKRIDHQLSCLCPSAVTSAGTQYLADLLNIYLPSRQLRSSSDARIVKHSSASSKFRSLLKSHLFKQ